MKHSLLVAVGLVCAFGLQGREAKLVRYPDYSHGRVAFSYLGDIWTANEDGSNLQRITANPARDVYPRFSPDGKWIAFSSDREGNLDVYVVPAAGGQPKQLTFHTADDNVLGWSPDSQSILFSSNRGEFFMAKMYLVNVEGGMERAAGPDFGLWGTFSPDGKHLAINRKGQVYWRKYYRGANNTDVTVMDLETKKFTDLTDFEGEDSWPMWSRDGHIYFVSDRDGNGLTNIWRVPDHGEKPKAEKITAFTAGDVRWPSISADGKTIVFEHDFGISKLDVATHKVTPLSFNIAAEPEDNLTAVESFASRADDYDLAPNGRRVAFSIHGEVFTAPVDTGDLVQITDNPARDQQPRYSPDGKQIAFVSDRSGREEIYVTSADGAGDASQITNLDALKYSYKWSPDSKALVYTTSENQLRKYDLASKQTVELASSKYGQIGAPVWSPDGKWIAYSKADQTRNADIYLVAVTGGEEHKATFDFYSELNPRFSADGKKLYFQRMDGGVDSTAGTRPAEQIWSVLLEKQDVDPDEPVDRGDDAESAATPAARRGNQPVKDVNIDWAGLKRRTRQVTHMPFPILSYAPSPDNRTIVFAASETGATASTPVLYSIQDNGTRMSRLSAISVAPEGGAAGRGRGGRGAGGGTGGFVRDLQFTRDGRSVFFMESGGIYSASVPGAGAAGTGARGAASGAGENAGSGVRRVNFDVKVRINKPAEWAEMFGDAWRTMKYRFYDPKMHGFDWDQMRAKYQPLVEYIADRQELLNIVNEMIGELNASHTGAAPAPGARVGATATAHLGVELEPDEAAGRYKVAYVYEDGPADKDWVKVHKGDYLIAIDGKPVIAGQNYWELLNFRLNRKVAVKFNSKPVEDGAWVTRIEPAPLTGYSDLRYERWVKERKEEVTKLSDGKIGYLHIKAMDAPSLRRFEKEIRENRDKKALIIDQRWNGGGNIEQELLAILVQREYQIWQPRGTEPSGRPFAGFFGPKVVLQNWRSASNAEMFPAGFRALGLGKLIGTPTYGAVIGTGSYSLIDGSTVRTPGVGVYLADSKQTNMEGYGVKPDILIENLPEDNLAGRDRQLERAVEELKKGL